MNLVGMRRRLGPVAVAAMIGSLVLVGAAGPVQVLAQDSGTPTMDAAGFGRGTVAVNGHGSVRVEPDTAQITIGVSVTLPSLDEAQAQSATQAQAIIDAITAAGVAEEDLQTSNFNVFVVRNYDPQGNPSEITGYQISNQVNVTVRDVTAISEVLTTAIDAGANDIWGITFYVDDQTAAQSEARQLAVADARRKAEELAAAAGQSVGRVVAIAEGTGAALPQPMYAQRGGAGMAADQAMSAPIQTGLSEVTIDVQVVFELEDE